MTSTAKTATGEDPNHEKKQENEKKKRSRVKQLLADVKKQVEFWFGDVNLHKDRFMKDLFEKSRDGYIDLSVLTTFNKMKKMTTNVKLIARALKNSALLEVNLEGTHVRRKYPLSECPKDVDDRTVYVELLPKTVTHLWIEKVFSKCGKVVYVSIPRFKSTKHSKGFAFVEFEKVEQALKAIKMLNNPPEDAPKKPGIFPKTCGKKTIPVFPAQGTKDEEMDGKKKKKLRSKTELQNKAAVNKDSVDAVVNSKKRLTEETEIVERGISSKKAEKKRRRSHSVDAAAEDQNVKPSKKRKVEEVESTEIELKDLTSEDKMDDQPDSDKKDDSYLKAKRKRKKHKEKLKTEEEVIPLRVLSKKEWLKLKEEFLVHQKHSMTFLKRSVTQIHQKPVGSEDVPLEEERHNNTSLKDATKKEIPSGPEFVNGVIVKISHNQPLPSRQCVKDSLSKVSTVAYVDVLEGDAEGHLRFNSPEDAQAVIAARSELQKKFHWNFELLTGDHEQRYWQKILVDRQAKLNRPREKKRGTEKLLFKAEKIVIARAKEATKHIRFDD